MELLQPSSLAEIDGGLAIHGGTEVVPLLRDGILEADRLVDIRGVVPRGVDGNTIGAGTTLAELEAGTTIPAALREACTLAASPQLRNMSSLGGNLLQSTRCWYWRLDYPCRLHGGDRCHAREGEHREHAIFANDYCASAHPSDIAAALLALGARVRTTKRELPQVEASTYLKAMDRKRWSFPQVGVAAARVGGEVRIALAGVAPIPWLLGPDGLDAATPLPRTAWKVQVARALVARATSQLA